MAQTKDLAKQVKKTKSMSITQMIEASAKELGRALPSHMRPERIVRIALTTLRLNPKLYECNPHSFLGALFQSAQLGLEPNVEGQAYIIPYKNNKKVDGKWVSMMEAQFQIGYKGYVELFYRHEAALSLDMQVVRENDDFDWSYGTESFIKHKPAMKNRGEVVGYYAVGKLKGGAHIFKFMSQEDCMEHGKQYSKCWDKQKGEFYANTPWRTSPDAMCMKTVLMQLMKLLPKSIEIQKAVAMDETVKTKVAADMFEIKDEANWDEAPEDAGKVVDVEQIDEKGSETTQEPPQKQAEQGQGGEIPKGTITEPQKKKIFALGKKLGQDKDEVDATCQDLFGKRLSQFDKKEASQIIEDLIEREKAIGQDREPGQEG